MEKKIELPVVQQAGKRSGMSRRQLAQLLLSGAAAGLAMPALAATHPVHKHLADEATFGQATQKAAAAQWKPEFLEPHQNETLIVLAERIIPGSTRANVNRFIDLLLSVESREVQQKFLNSLSAFDALALNRFEHPFKGLSEAQQNELLTFASTQEAAVKRGEGRGTERQATTEPERVTIRDHFENIKDWARGAYYSSEVGMKELGWNGEVAWDSFPGCQHPEGHH